MRAFKTLASVLLCILAACGSHRARSDKGFDEIREMVAGRSAVEIENILGKPDSKQSMLSSGERWIWWNYTYLGGKDYPPDLRGKVVHLEIIFDRHEKAGIASASMAGELRASKPFGVSYSLPQISK